MIPELCGVRVEVPGEMERPMLQVPRFAARQVARRVLWLALAVFTLQGQGHATPLIAVRPDSIGPIELPAHEAIGLPIRIYDRDSAGPTPLMWALSVVFHGTDSIVPWVSPSPASGEVAPADSADVTIVVSTWGASGGPYSLDVRIDNNDPSRPRVVIPAALTVVVPVPVRRPTLGELKARYRKTL